MKKWFLSLPPIIQLILGAAIIGGSIWLVTSVYHSTSNMVSKWIDNYKDAQIVEKDKEIEAIKEKNNKEIAIYVADNAKLKAERDAQDVITETLRQSIANDGKIIKSEQVKINEATRKYNETKDSCISITNSDEYVQCVCTKLAVDCS